MKCEPQTIANMGFVALQMVQSEVSLDEAVEAFRLSLVRNSIQHHAGNQCKAARALGVHRNTVTRILNGVRG